MAGGPCILATAGIRLSTVVVGGVTYLTADPILSAQKGNGVAVNSDGLYVPSLTSRVATGTPANPPDGMMIWKSPDTGCSWTFRYNAGSTASYKWEFIGGSPMWGAQESQGGISGPSGGWNTLSASDVAGPSVQIPETGVYEVAFGARIIIPVTGQIAEVGVSLGGADPADDCTARLAAGTTTSAGANDGTNVERHCRISVQANTTVSLRYRGTGGSGTCYFGHRWMAVTPIRLA